MIRPLAGITIAEAYAPDSPLALRLAGALAGRIAADLGARVVKLEPADDPMRGIAPFVGGISTTFAFVNAGKTFVSGDGAEALAKADVAIVDAATFHHTSGLPPVAAVLSMFRHDAEHGPASEFTVMALGGLLDMVGDPGREPLKLGGHQAAYAAGLAAYTGIAAALCRPRVSGKIPAETVHVSMLDTLVWLNWKSVPSKPSQPVLTRTGAAAEWQVVRCADGFIALVYQDPDWPTVCEVVGDARLRDARFADRAGRVDSSGEVARIIEERFLILTRRELHALALTHRIPLGPVWSPRELRADPQTASRDFLMPANLDGHRVTMPRLPVIWGGETFAPGAIPARANAKMAALG